MSDNLLILITRTLGNDEWQEVWRFPQDHLIAFVRQNQCTTLAVTDVNEVRLDQEVDADVWIVNGRRYRSEDGKKVNAAFNNVDWKGKAVTLRIHLGAATSREFQEYIQKLPHEKTAALLKKAEKYSIGDTNPPEHPVVRFATAIREKSPATIYLECLKALTAKTSLYMRIANTMHRLSYVLHPLDIDFQGLQDTNFQIDYWQEVVEDYKGGKALGRLSLARDLIYKRSGNENDTAENVIRDAADRFQTGPWEESWEALQRDFLPRDRGPETIESILLLAQDGSSVNLEKIKTHFADGKNPVHTWVINIDRALSDVRDALSERERRVKPEQRN